MIFDYLAIMYSFVGILLILCFCFLAVLARSKIIFLNFLFVGLIILFKANDIAKIQYEALINFKNDHEIVYIKDKFKGDPYDS